ncbi:MAG TPA: hypothetical protein VGQ99_05515 [Tepidisphaeraceae bacterium]|jgi:hypothetical protein|nr:hypothetical protein [Tepidisphaeraceae bacterium]
MTNKVFATVCVLGLLASGCASHDDTEQGGVYGARQEGNLDASPGRDTREPYAPVMGDTTGDGLRKDMRTGGGITGKDVTPAERVNENDKTRTNDGGAGATSGGGATPGQ